MYTPLRGRQQELEENVGIYFEDNYEQISVPVPHFGGSDPADIIHDFQRVGEDSISLFFFCPRGLASPGWAYVLKQ